MAIPVSYLYRRSAASFRSPFPPHRLDLFGPQKTRTALALPSEAQLVIRPMLLRLFRVLAAAARLATHIVLFGDAARMQGPQFQQFALEPSDTPLNLGQIHYADGYIMSIGGSLIWFRPANSPLWGV
jgi:hypothetical protein